MTRDIHLVPVVSEHDADVLIHQWNDTDMDFPEKHGEFSRHVYKHHCYSHTCPS